MFVGKLGDNLKSNLIYRAWNVELILLRIGTTGGGAFVNMVMDLWNYVFPVTDTYRRNFSILD
jgi:hypothetical protein